MKIDTSLIWTAKKLANLSNLDITVVGGTGGLGRAISQEFAKAGAKVTVVGQTFRDSDIANIKFIKADLSSIADTKKLANTLDVSKTDILLFTTGIFAARQRQETPEGLERDLAVSFLNRLVTVEQVAPKMHTSKYFSDGPRVFVMAYPGSDQLGTPEDLNSEKNYGVMSAHMNTVAGNEALVYASDVKYDGIHFYGLNPGMVRTNIRDNLFGKSMLGTVVESLVGWFTQTPEQYAQGIAPLLIADELDGYSGKIFNNKGKGLYPSKGFDTEYAKRFIKSAEDLLKSKGL